MNAELENHIRTHELAILIGQVLDMDIILESHGAVAYWDNSIRRFVVSFREYRRQESQRSEEAAEWFIIETGRMRARTAVLNAITERRTP